MQRMFAILTLCWLLLPATFAQAQETTLSYDDGTGEGWMSNVEPDSLEDVMFFVEHPATLLRVRMVFATEGPVSVHIWHDGGGNDPDRSRERITPIGYTVSSSEVGQWVTFEMSEGDLEIEALRNLHVGLIRLEDGPGLMVDTSTAGQGMSFLYPDDDPTVKYGISDGNFMVQTDVTFHDINENQRFTDITATAGVTGASRLAWGDCDNDGDDDLLLSASKLYRNNGDGTFTDISEAAGISGLPGSGMWADYDNDGRLDYYAFSRGDSFDTRDRLVHNEGDCTFLPVEDSTHTPWDLYPTEAVGWADYDNDGWVDLYVANYEESGEEISNGTPNFLWRNLGDGHFVDATRAAGVYREYPQCGRGVSWGDFDNDGFIDLYVSNYRLDPNFLFHNNGDGTFTEEAQARGVQGKWAFGSYGHSIGSVWGDFDNDQDLDLFVGNLAHPRFISSSDKSMLYVNSGAPDYTFSDIREQTAITYAETHSDPLWWDSDNDGFLDLFITSIYSECVSFFYRNDGAGDFVEQSYASGAWVKNGWGVATADIDRDGDLDLMTRKLFENGLLSPSSKTAVNNWLEVRVIGHKTNAAGIGVRLSVTTGEHTQIRQVEGGKGTGVQSSLVQHVGLGDAQSVDSLTVTWTDGSKTTLTDVAVNQLIEVEEDADPVCLNHAGECLSDTRLRTCRNWQWVEEDCPEGWVCEDRFCLDPNPVDGDMDAESDGDLDDEIEMEAETEMETDGDEEPEADLACDPDCDTIALCEEFLSEHGRVYTPNAFPACIDGQTIDCRILAGTDCCEGTGYALIAQGPCDAPDGDDDKAEGDPAPDGDAGDPYEPTNGGGCHSAASTSSLLLLFMLVGLFTLKRREKTCD